MSQAHCDLARAGTLPTGHPFGPTRGELGNQEAIVDHLARALDSRTRARAAQGGGAPRRVTLSDYWR